VVAMDRKVVKTEKGTEYFVVAAKKTADVTSSTDVTSHLQETQSSNIVLLDSSSLKESRSRQSPESILSFTGEEEPREVKDLASYVQFIDVGDDLIQETLAQ